MASELEFAPADGVRSFPEGWYWTGTPVGVGVWSFPEGWYCPDPPCGWFQLGERLTASENRSADPVVEAMRVCSRMTAVRARKRAQRQGFAIHLL